MKANAVVVLAHFENLKFEILAFQITHWECLFKSIIYILNGRDFNLKQPQ